LDINLGFKTWGSISFLITIYVWYGIKLLVGIKTPPIVTRHFPYLRFIGDRSLQKKYFGRTQKNRTPEIGKWINRIKTAQLNDAKEENKRLGLGIVAANNHYAGFEPISAIIFRQMMGLIVVIWDKKAREKQEIRNSNSYASDLMSRKEQKTLTDFFL
jgi:hypothetical protein